VSILPVLRLVRRSPSEVGSPVISGEAGSKAEGRVEGTPSSKLNTKNSKLSSRSGIDNSRKGVARSLLKTPFFYSSFRSFRITFRMFSNVFNHFRSFLPATCAFDVTISKIRCLWHGLSHCAFGRKKLPQPFILPPLVLFFVNT